MNWAILFAIASPLLFGLMNIIDKYVVAHRVRKPLGFAFYAAWFSAIIGLIIAFCLDWTGISLPSLIFPALTGLVVGAYFFFYYYIMQKEDASNLVGLTYSYPLVVAILSFFILNEKIALIGYIGLLLIISGVFVLSVRLNKIKMKVGIVFILILILYTALWEFMVKIVTNNVPVWHGFAVSSIFNALVPSLFLFSSKIRSAFVYELKNFRWAFLTEIFTFLGSVTLYLAMAGLPATVVSSIAAIQPLAVLFYERIMDSIFGKMSRDHLLLPKLAGIVLIVLGVILISTGFRG